MRCHSKAAGHAISKRATGGVPSTFQGGRDRRSYLHAAEAHCSPRKSEGKSLSLRAAATVFEAVCLEVLRSILIPKMRIPFFSLWGYMRNWERHLGYKAAKIFHFLLLVFNETVQQL